MFRRRALLALLGLTLVHSTPLGATPPLSLATIEADRVEIDPDDETTYASGNALLSYQNFELHADAITADRTSGRVEAAGDLHLLHGGRRLTGESLEYDLMSAEGSLKKARAVEQGVVITGEEIRVSPTEVVAHDAFFTTCDREEPHYALAAKQITLTAEDTTPGQPSTSGRLSLSHGRVLFRGRTILPVPGYSVRVGEIGTTRGAPSPVFGITGDDGPYASMGYQMSRPASPWFADFTYRYTTSRGIRGLAKVGRYTGPAELSLAYIRREDPADRVAESDDLEASLADVLVDRKPEYGLVLPDFRIARPVTLRASWLAGSYTEFDSEGTEDLARADRTSLNVLLTYAAYPLGPSVKLSHAIGWRQSRYSPGDELRVRHFRNAADIRLNARLRLELSHISRRESGQSPFLFDGVGPHRELLGEVTWTVNSAWRLRLVEYYDLEKNETRDMILEATRTAHCLEYRLGWRRERGTFYVGFGLAPPSAYE
ncbi:MAG TPA: LptA/OstA family protein [Armatimonadota bacterium]|nr:LptA/OstA family protein [Armatimonadota bacterium]